MQIWYYNQSLFPCSRFRFLLAVSSLKIVNADNSDISGKLFSFQKHGIIRSIIYRVLKSIRPFNLLYVASSNPHEDCKDVVCGSGKETGNTRRKWRNGMMKRTSAGVCSWIPVLSLTTLLGGSLFTWPMMRYTKGSFLLFKCIQDADVVNSVHKSIKKKKAFSTKMMFSFNRTVIVATLNLTLNSNPDTISASLMT